MGVQAAVSLTLVCARSRMEPATGFGSRPKTVGGGWQTAALGFVFCREWVLWATR